MKYNLIIALTVLVSIANTGFTQERPNSSDRQEFVIVPTENVTLLIAAQPGSPIIFEDAKLLMSTDGAQFGFSYKLHNRGTRSIRYVSPIMLTSFGTGGTLAGTGPPLSGELGRHLILPGETYSQEMKYDIVPLTNKLREKLNLREPTRAIVVLMIESVRFDDGSTYQDEETVTALRSYFRNLSEKLNSSPEMIKR